jgi:cardiolipin synthase
MTVNTQKLFSRPEYFIELIKLVDNTKRGDRVAIATMTFDSRQPLIAKLIDSLCMAAQRSVQVHLTIDAYTFLARERSVIPGPLWWRQAVPKKLPEPYRQYMYDLEKLKANGGHYGISNIPAKPFSPPPKGRSHIKGAVVNNQVFIGGCNLEAPEHTDVMVAQTNAKLADWLYDWIVKLATTQATAATFHAKDQTLQVAPDMEVFIDAGVPKQSTIYDHALQLIDDAQEWIFLTCQFFPGGETASHLYAAHKRGVAVRIIYSHPHTHGQKAFMHYAYNAVQRLQLPAQFFIDRRPKDAPLLHAKVVATDTGAMVGSHNYVEQGVWLGTAEIALLSHDKAFSEQLIDKINAEL